MSVIRSFIFFNIKYEYNVTSSEQCVTGVRRHVYEANL